MIRCDERIALETLPSQFPYSGKFALSCKTKSLLMITNHFVSSLYFWECVDQSYFTPSARYKFFYSSCLFYIKIYCKLTNSSFGNRWLFLKLFPNEQFVNVKRSTSADPGKIVTVFSVHERQRRYCTAARSGSPCKS